MAIIQEGVDAEAKKFGITIIDVRIKRAALPQANSEAILTTEGISFSARSAKEPGTYLA